MIVFFWRSDTWWRHQMKIFPRYWPFVRGIHRSPVNSPHKGQWRGALMFSLIYVWIISWVNNREAGDLRRYGPLAISKILGCAYAPGMPGTFSPPPRVSDPGMHHGTCVTHVPWCMPGSLSNDFLWSRRRGNVPSIPGACAIRKFTYLVRSRPLLYPPYPKDVMVLRRSRPPPVARRPPPAARRPQWC